MRNRYAWIGIAILLALGLALALLVGLTGESAAAQGVAPSATVRYVAPAGACGGASPCYATLQAAADAAAPGDEIRIAAGSYTGISARAGSKQVLFLSKSLTVRGGFTTANWQTPNPATQPTTVDAQGLGRGVVISGTVPAAPAVTLEGLRITGGNATGLGGYGGPDRPAGGGVYVYLATATIRNCTITGNTANAGASGFGYGGGLAAMFSTLSLESSTVENNRASVGGIGNGGGVLVKNYTGWGGPVSLTGNTIRNNTASTGAAGWGGGVLLDTVSATLTGNTLAGNTATSVAGAPGYGGGLRADASELTLSDNTVRGNKASAAGWGSGGGIFFNDVNATLTGNRLAANIAAVATTGDGGGLYATSNLAVRTATVTLTGNTVEDNAACGNAAPVTALCRGGGIELWQVVATLTGNTIQRNTAGNTATGNTPVNNLSRGGGISLNEPFDSTLTDNTVSDNVANLTGYGYGGGIEVSAQTARGEVTLTGNAVRGNTGSLGFTGQGGGVFASGVTVTLSGNVLAGNTASKGKIGFGGGFYADSGALTLRDNTIENNVASTADQGVGGGLSFSNVTLDLRAAATLTGNTVRGNTGSTATANTSGWKSGAGGLDLFWADATVSDNSFSGNTGATAQEAYCGGVAIYTGDHTAAVSFTGNLVEDNVAGAAAAGGLGGGLCASGRAVVSGNTIIDNTAATAGHGNGGGAAMGPGPRGGSLSGPTVFSDNTVRGNLAATTGDGQGGGLYVARRTMLTTDVFTVTGNLIADNVASQSGAGSGGGIYLGPSYVARLDANTIVGNVASNNAGMTGVGGGLSIASSHAFSVTNCVIAHNRADTQGSGVWMGKPSSVSDPATWGRFLHTTIADNQVGAGVWLESPLPAGTLSAAYSGGTQLKVTTPCFYRVGDSLLILHTNGSTRAWRTLVAIRFGDTWQLTIDSPLPGAFPTGSSVRDASAMFVNTIVARQPTGLGAKDQPVTLVNTLWNGNGANTTDNLDGILTQGDVSGAPVFVNGAANDYHITAGSAAKDTGVNAGVTTDMDGQARPIGAGYDIGADEFSGQAPTPTPTLVVRRHTYLPLLRR